MSTLTAAHLRAIMPNAPENDAEDELPHVLETARRYEITTKARFAAWIANVAVESGELMYVEELADGTAYEQRTDLGNTFEIDGDGPLYKGRGYIQITGAHNTRVVGEALGIDAVEHPELLSEMPYAWLSAGYYWRYMSSYGDLNELADAGDFDTTCLGVNGGWNGYAERLAYYQTALEVLPDDLDLSEAGDPEVSKPDRIIHVAGDGWLYDATDSAYIKIVGLTDPASTTLTVDENGYPRAPIPAIVPEAPIPAPAELVLGEKRLGAEASGWYAETYPSHHGFDDDVMALVLKYEAMFADIYLNTYKWHPPVKNTRIWEARSFDVWGLGGRGFDLDPELGDLVFAAIFNDPDGPLIEWIIYKGWMWSRKGGWEVWDPPEDGSDPGHWKHIHVSYAQLDDE